MLFTVGKRYMFQTPLYAYSGTVRNVTPTHVELGDDAMIHYGEFGDLGLWSKGTKKGGGSAVPGQVVSTLNADGTPIP